MAISEEAGVVKRRRTSVVRRSCKGEGLRSAIVMRNGGKIEGRWEGASSTGREDLYSRLGGQGGAMCESAR
jgi:hypothetical protein